MTKMIGIVSCTAHKRGSAMTAEELYASPLFFKSRRYAQANFDDWLILSAMHGLVRPDEVIEPYDRKLSSLSKKQHQDLAQTVKRQAHRLVKEGASFVSICGAEYDTLLLSAGLSVRQVPEFALPIGKKLRALSRVTDPNQSEGDLDAAYKIIRPLVKTQKFPRLRDTAENPIPQSGIYLFFDENEHRLKDNTQVRVVRVGTHGVAAGSKASLRNRIRTHLGTSSGEGSHRSSIFRSHVGRSLINAGRFSEVSSWGDGATARKESVPGERELEQAVSKYLGGLRVLFLAVPGESDKSNDRAYLEQNLIALFSNVLKPLDPPSHSWLGNYSSKKEIRKSGLWNVNHVSQRYEVKFLDVLEYYVSLTNGNKPPPARQLAPQGWLAQLRIDADQFAFF